MIHVGNALNVLKVMAAEGVQAQCIVTSPPYWGLRKYEGEQEQVWDGDPACQHQWGADHISACTDSRRGTMQWTTGGDPGAKVLGQKVSQGQFCQLCGAWRGGLGLEPTPDLFIQHIVQIFRASWDVLADDGCMFLNLGDSYASGGTGGSSPKSTLMGYIGPHVKQAQMNQNPITRKPPPGLKPKDLCGMPWRVALALQADGWYLRSDIIWAKPNPMPESCRDRPTKAHEYLFLLTKKPRYYWDTEGSREKPADTEHTRARYKYAPSPAKKAEQNDDVNWENDDLAQHWGNPAGRNCRTVWTIPTQPTKIKHFATFPEELVRRCIQAGTSNRGHCPQCGARWTRQVQVDYEPAGGRGENEKTLSEEAQAGMQAPGPQGMKHGRANKQVQTLGWRPSCSCGQTSTPDLVLDPFAGSGTTLLVARKMGRDAVGIDLSPEYAALAKRRLGLLWH
jgi:DNA modification methylase